MSGSTSKKESGELWKLWQAYGNPWRDEMKELDETLIQTLSSYSWRPEVEKGRNLYSNYYIIPPDFVPLKLTRLKSQTFR